jgi:cell division protein FtsW
MTRNIDAALIMLWLAALTVGFVMVASASAPLAAAGASVGPFVVRHGAYLLTAMAACAVCALMPLRFWQVVHQPLVLIAIALAILVVIPGIGNLVNGARRWISLGAVSVQPAEIGKFALVVYLAGFLARHHRLLGDSFLNLTRPLLAVGALGGLFLLQPDFGSVVVIAAVTAGMLFMAGARLWHFLALSLGAGVLLAAVTLTQPYRVERLVTFLDPWSVAYGSGYQLTQALIAFGRGDWTGLGLGEGIQKLFYLPEAHNDFIFAVIVEELGLIGAAAVLGLLVALVLRIMQVAGEALEGRRYFAAFLAYGAGLTIGVQCLINVGVNTGTLPTKGLTLPFVSYGGNSLVVCSALLGLVLRARLEPGRNP